MNRSSEIPNVPLSINLHLLLKPGDMERLQPYDRTWCEEKLAKNCEKIPGAPTHEQQLAAHEQQCAAERLWMRSCKPSSGGREGLFTRLRRRWIALMVWSPSDAQIDRVVGWTLAIGPIADLLLKTIVIGAAFYFLFECGSAFLHGGAVERMLSGGR